MNLECWSCWSGGKEFLCVVLQAHTVWPFGQIWITIKREFQSCCNVFYFGSLYLKELRSEVCLCELYHGFSVERWWYCFCSTSILGALWCSCHKELCMPMATRYCEEVILLKSDLLDPTFSGFFVTCPASSRLCWFGRVKLFFPTVAEVVSVPVSHLK